MSVSATGIGGAPASRRMRATSSAPRVPGSRVRVWSSRRCGANAPRPGRVTIGRNDDHERVRGRGGRLHVVGDIGNFGPRRCARRPAARSVRESRTGAMASGKAGSSPRVTECPARVRLAATAKPVLPAPSTVTSVATRSSPPRDRAPSLRRSCPPGGHATGSGRLGSASDGGPIRRLTKNGLGGSCPASRTRGSSPERGGSQAARSLGHRPVLVARGYNFERAVVWWPLARAT